MITSEPDVLEQEPSIGPWTDISDLKKALKRISNKRALIIASKFSGDDQDAALKKLIRDSESLEADLSRCRSLQGLGEARIKAGELRSNIAPAAHGNASIRIDTVIRDAENMKSYLKEEIRKRRQQIREEAEEHEEYGLRAEDAIQQLIAQASLSNNKVSRARRRLQESQAIEESVSHLHPPNNPSPTRTSIHYAAGDGKQSSRSPKQASPVVEKTSPIQESAPKVTSKEMRPAQQASPFLSEFLSDLSPASNGSAREWSAVDFRGDSQKRSQSSLSAKPANEAAKKILSEINWDNLSEDDDDDDSGSDQDGSLQAHRALNLRPVPSDTRSSQPKTTPDSKEKPPASKPSPPNLQPVGVRAPSKPPSNPVSLPPFTSSSSTPQYTLDSDSDDSTPENGPPPMISSRSADEQVVHQDEDDLEEVFPA